MTLRCSGVTLNNEKDSIVWTWNHTKGDVTVKMTYDALVAQNLTMVFEWWYKALWKIQVPAKIILFVWLCLHDRILTGENYRRRGGIGPSVCFKSAALDEEDHGDQASFQLA
jgi:hypothetical protein